MLFALKKIIATFFFPVAWLGVLLGLGAVLLWRSGPSQARWGRRLVTGAAILFWMLGSNWVGDAVLWPLLRQYPMLDVAALRGARGADWAPDYLVVLAAGHYPMPHQLPAVRLSERSLARVNMAFQLHRAFPRTPIVCTGGTLHPGFDPISRDMAAVLREWGVDADLVLTEEAARDTQDHVRYLRQMLAGKSFLLVTSASHMPRSMALFRHAGLEPVAAPEMDLELSSREPRNLWRGLVPNGGNFGRVERAAYEYLGLLWAKLRGQI